MVKIVLLSLFTFLIFSGCFRTKGETVPEREIQILIYKRGEEKSLNPESPRFHELQKHAEDLLSTADNLLRLAVTPETIREIQSSEFSIELVYREPKAFVIPFNQTTLRPYRILIPLTGEFGGEEGKAIATLFHGYPEYSGGPYRNSSGLSEIRRILRLMNEEGD